MKRESQANAYGGLITTRLGTSDHVIPPGCVNLPLWSTKTPTLSCSKRNKGHWDLLKPVLSSVEISANLAQNQFTICKWKYYRGCNSTTWKQLNRKASCGVYDHIFTSYAKAYRFSTPCNAFYDIRCSKLLQLDEVTTSCDEKRNRYVASENCRM